VGFARSGGASAVRRSQERTQGSNQTGENDMTIPELLQTFASLSDEDKAMYIAYESMAKAAFLSFANDAQMTCDSDAEITHQLASVVSGVVREAFIAMKAIHGEDGVEMFATVLRAVVAQTIEDLESTT
jgi:hypothetical protein